MIIAPKHPQENLRLEALYELGILDTSPEKEFDDITLLASKICNTPMALISLVDKDRQWFKSKYGIEATEAPRDLAFCAHAILQNQVLHIPNSKEDIRFFDNPFVTGEAKVEFYAGVPILDPTYQLPIGTLCVVGNKPQRLNEEQIELLVALRNQVQKLLVLRLQLKQKEDILEGAGLGSWDWWIETNKVHFDVRWCKMLGIDYCEKSQDLDTWENRVHPDDIARTYRDLNAYLEGKTPSYENIHRLKHSNGDWIWILDRGKISGKDESGKPIRFTGTHFDITSYKKEESIASRIQEIANIGGWELNNKDQTMHWTDQTYKIHQISPQLPITKNIAIEFFAPQERSKLLTYLEECLNGIPFRETFELIDVKGIKKWIEVTGVPIINADKKITNIMGTYKDISALLKTKNQLEEAQQLAKIGNWKFDLHTSHQTWSSEHYRIFEIPEPQSQENLNKLYRERVHPDDLPDLDLALERALQKGENFVYNHRVYLDGGKRIKYVKGIGKVTLDSNGKPLYVSGTCQDISEKVLAENEIELSRSKAVHAAKLASLGEMSAGIAHEINNPLAIISGTLGLLKKSKNDEAKFDSRIEAMNKAVSRIAKIVNGLRKFSRTSDSGEMNLCCVHDIIKEALIITETKSKRHGVSILLDIQTEDKTNCNSIEIEQVIINLINNAIDAVNELPDKWVKLKLFTEENEIILQVIDAGKGIDPEFDKKLFQPFFTTKPVGEGTGLGLSICKGILDNHKATLSINRKLSNTCFEIRFKNLKGMKAAS